MHGGDQAAWQEFCPSSRHDVAAESAPRKHRVPIVLHIPCAGPDGTGKSRQMWQKMHEPDFSLREENTPTVDNMAVH